ncbi:exodeoxyribonuclease VII small subunit [Halotalea alkalilenta]|uniref:exodeoxyribonuclease VII small subunit n=1 Tax=Halotalea alkalilenta TaxID=376489 RepID=UPI000482D0F8|nr:exodeoxyribonuclease VII small subunit [Halotalea alkalilenta]
MAEQHDEPRGADGAAPDEEDFAATLSRLEALVERLEAGDLSLEASLTAFEQGVRLTRDARKRLESAELKVKTLLERDDGGVDERPFEEGA